VNCDRQLLSEYHDNLLATELREEIQRHLAACDECRRTLTSYRNLGAALASIAAPPVPVSLRVRFNRSLDHGARPQLSLGLVAPFGALAAAALAFVFVATFATRPSTALAVVAAYPPNGATGVVLDDAIAVEFNSPVEEQTLGELQFRLEPPVPIETTILGSKVVLRPIVPLRPDTQYVVRIERAEKSTPSKQIAILPPPPTAAPLTVNFSTGRNVAAAASATAARGSTPLSPTPAPAVALVPAPPAAPTAPALGATTVPAATNTARPDTSAAALVSTRTPSPITCGTATSSRVAFALRGRAELPARLGCAVAVERVVTYDEEPNGTGLLVAVDDGRSRVTLLSDGRWVVADGPATPTPAPTLTPARPATASPSATASPVAIAETPPATSAAGTPPAATPSPDASSATPLATAPAVSPTAAAPGTAGTTASPTPSSAAELTATAISTAPSSEATTRPKNTVADSGAVPVPTASPTSIPVASLTATPATSASATATIGRQPTATLTAASTATSTATNAEPSRFAWVQVFEHGSVLLAPTADGSLGYVLLDDGSDRKSVV
jgi:hypothetical protein